MRILTLLFLLPWASCAQLATMPGGLLSAATSGASYLLTQDFEAGTEPSGWTHSGTVQYNYTPSIVGTYSLYTTNGSYSQTASFGSVSTVHLFMAFSVGAAPTSNAGMFYIRDNGSINLASVAYRTTGELRVNDASATQLITLIASAIPGTTYYLWLDETAGTGSNQSITAYFSTTSTKPGSPTGTITTGTGTSNASRLRLGSDAGTATVYDYVRVSTALIGSSPP